MTLAGMIVIGAGVLVLGIGLVFIIPYKNVKRLAGDKVRGEIVDMVWNAGLYNAPLDEAAGVEQSNVAGVEFPVGTRTRGFESGVTHISVGDGQPDPNKVVLGRGTVNMYHKVYRYVVNGREYTRADGVRYDKGTVQSWIGKSVTVYYNPENPQQSTLSNGGGYKLTMIILYVVGGLLMLLGLLFIVLG